MNMASKIAPLKNSSETSAPREPELIGRLACYAAIGLFSLALLAVLHNTADIMAPIVSSIVVGALLARFTDRLTRLGMSPYLAGIFVIGATLATGVAIVNALVEPFSALVERAPDMVNALTQIISPILRPLTNIRHALASAPGAAAPAAAIGGETDWLVAFLGRLTPALGQLMIFFASLAFFVSGRSALRRQLIMSMPERASRLSAIRAIAAVEQALSHYFGATTLIYVAVAALTGLVAWVGGLPSPLLWMAMTFIASYIPYFGVAIIALALAASGFLAHPHSLMALPPAAGYLVLHLSSETFIIPTLLGRRHEINPFVIFISIVFWSWMWGPVGAILASPLLLSAQTVIGLLSEPEGYLP